MNLYIKGHCVVGFLLLAHVLVPTVLHIQAHIPVAGKVFIISFSSITNYTTNTF